MVWFCFSYDFIVVGGSGINDLKIINRSENKVFNIVFLIFDF